jgi:hypothetical protein
MSMQPSPASRALAVLFEIQDILPDCGVRLVERQRCLLVLVPDINTWEDWTVHLELRHGELVAQHLDMTAAEAHMEAYLLVEQYPVEVLLGRPAERLAVAA